MHILDVIRQASQPSTNLRQYTFLSKFVSGNSISHRLLFALVYITIRLLFITVNNIMDKYIYWACPSKNAANSLTDLGLVRRDLLLYYFILNYSLTNAIVNIYFKTLTSK